MIQSLSTYNCGNPHYSIRSIAVMVGSLIPDFVFSKVQPMLFLACAITINGVALALIPTFTNIIIFNICITVTGFTFGIVDMGVQSLILKSWVRALGEQQIYFNFRAWKKVGV